MHRRLFAMLLLALLLGGALVPAGGEAIQTPVLSVHGEELSWTAAEASSTYRLLTETASGRRISTVESRAVTPPAVAGEAVTSRVKAAVNGSPWSNAVTIVYREGEEQGSPPPAKGLTVGVNAGGWGPSAYADLAGAGA